MGRRVRGAAAGNGAAGTHRANQSADNSGPTLWPVQLVAQQPHGTCRHSVRGRRRRAGAIFVRLELMTALSACIGLLPGAISTGIGSQVQRPLATVVVGKPKLRRV